MVYLAIMFIVAATGIATLWVQQRRERAHLETVDGFRRSLAKIAPEAAPGPFARSRRPRSRTPGRRVPLDPAKREAARRRVEARRRAALARATASSRRF